MSNRQDDPSPAPTPPPPTISYASAGLPDLAADAAPSSAPPRVDPAPGPIGDGGSGDQDRYQFRHTLGEGGMGEVRLCRDRRIGREVAMKLIRRGRMGSAGSDGRSDLRARFVREARVQGQLEHPAVVPVYDLGVGPDGEAWFTMKRVRGVTLDSVLKSRAPLPQGDRARTGSRQEPGEHGELARWSRRQLLGAFSQVCLAIDFAHQRGVLHRDLKPANIMLGDFGEVYVLDWGLARIEDHADLEAPDGEVPTDASLHTMAGALMGTPGYMAPEQARGDRDGIGRAADIYALGAILFEVLAGEPLHVRGGHPMATLAATVRGVDGHPAARAPDAQIPPELDEIAAAATALDPAMRPASARALEQAIERFLDGDRDLERRRELAEGHTRNATEAAARAFAAERSPVQRQSERTHALREVGRALALDPESDDAARTLVQLLTQPPAELPPAAGEALTRSLDATVRFTHRLTGLSYLAWLPILPLLIAMGVHDWSTFLLSWPLIAAIAVLNLYIARVHGRDPRRDLRLGYAGLAVNTVALAVASRMFGSYIVMPGIAALTGLQFAMHPNRRLRIIGVTAACLTIAGPALLEAVGVLPASYRYEGGRFLVVPQMLQFKPLLTDLFLLVTGLAVVVNSALFTGHVRDMLIASERRQIIQAWQLEQLVPVRAAVSDQAAVSPSTKRARSRRSIS